MIFFFLISTKGVTNWPSVFHRENTPCIMQIGLGAGLVASLLVGHLVPLCPPAKLTIIPSWKEKL